MGRRVIFLIANDSEDMTFEDDEYFFRFMDMSRRLAADSKTGSPHFEFLGSGLFSGYALIGITIHRVELEIIMRMNASFLSMKERDGQKNRQNKPIFHEKLLGENGLSRMRKLYFK